MSFTPLEKDMVLKAKHLLEQKHKGNPSYRVYPQDIVCELNHENNTFYGYSRYQGVKCSIKKVKEILKEVLL